MGGIRHIAIVVPARDETARIEPALAAIGRARCRTGPISTTSVVVIGSRADGTVDVVRRRLTAGGDSVSGPPRSAAVIRWPRRVLKLGES